MIPLTRARTEAAIQPTFRGAGLVGTTLQLLRDQRTIQRGELGKHAFDSDIWKQAKDQLLAETADKCAYCEAPTAVVSYGDVEHYRPKSKYWWLAYCVDNFLVACAICNQRFKSDKLPRKGSLMRAPSVRADSTDAHLEHLARTVTPDPLNPVQVNDFVALHDQERPLLLNPYFDDPAAYFAWRADVNLAEVELIARPEKPETQDYVAAAEADYGLNRKPLKGLRFFIFASYLTHKQTLGDPGISRATQAMNRQTIANMALPERPFAGMIRFFESVGEPADWETAGFLRR